jgi:hypothetical protein
MTGPIARKPRTTGRIPRESDLLAFQRLMLTALVRPLTSGDALDERWHDGRPMAEIASEFIKPTDRLSPAQRLQIYARCYWYRLLDGLQTDCPGLHAMLGAEKFQSLVRAYLAKYPSRSFTMRNLSAQLPRFILEEPGLTAPHSALAHAIAQFEWSQIVAFDAEGRPALSREDIARRPAHQLRVGLQPYISLLALDWPVDDYVRAVKKTSAMTGMASNAINRATSSASITQLARPRRRRVFVVVHRYELRLFYKRVDARAFAALQALSRGKTLAQAMAAAGPKSNFTRLGEQMGIWTDLGWFCRRC